MPWLLIGTCILPHPHIPQRLHRRSFASTQRQRESHKPAIPKRRFLKSYMHEPDHGLRPADRLQRALHVLLCIIAKEIVVVGQLIQDLRAAVLPFSVCQVSIRQSAKHSWHSAYMGLFGKFKNAKNAERTLQLWGVLLSGFCQGLVWLMPVHGASAMM